MGLAVAVAGTAGLMLSHASEAAPGPVPARAAIAEQRILTPRLTGGSEIASDAAPVQLIIPAIGVRTPLIRLSVRRSGALPVPATTNVAGWFDDGPSPGQPGPAIIAGHVDSIKGPGVFFDLSQLHHGDRVYVRRSDGSTVVFTVTQVRMYLKSAFPTTAVYGPAPGDQLRLITCGGAFDYRDRSYLSNVVVYAVALPVVQKRGAALVEVLAFGGVVGESYRIFVGSRGLLGAAELIEQVRAGGSGWLKAAGRLAALLQQGVERGESGRGTGHLGGDGG
jgi:hypothetical protein